MARRKILSQKEQAELQARADVELAKLAKINEYVVAVERKLAEKLDNESVLEQFLLRFPESAKPEVRLQMVNAQPERYTLEYVIKARYPDSGAAAQLPDKTSWPGSIADLARLINKLVDEELWPKETKWQEASDLLVDKTGSPIRAKQLNRAYNRLAFSSPIREDLRPLLLKARR